MPAVHARPIRRIAITTGGGDAPGLNAVICAVTRAALLRGWDCVGIRDGYDGLLRPERYPRGGCIALTRERVEGIASLGGTLLGSTNQGDPFAFPMPQAGGSVQLQDRSQDLLDALAREGIDALVAVGVGGGGGRAPPRAPRAPHAGAPARAPPARRSGDGDDLGGILHGRVSKTKLFMEQ